ncbi:MAG: UDP-N-acetylmuramoyl-L-alanyl-D-glutamate--2,6-diaminopimelate ligase [Candidatus Anoxychlamydiales bacterium]|nr:UDP-N-acetylmuramoyl-L-alanyl-D-glutamate--2,6-diaminopimelate ligase [Candidatus Anoxychlamydiales bacterium]NGX36336.1 UDP-N-acetylmuramoyl-L-alanyl-D-glutamate--2,6-diaminopimelate ligase [Candidatus Anoxychlamydiales bacterium]
MKLKKLLKDIEYTEIKGFKDVEISGITADSKVVAPGNLFIARKGEKFDGAEFIYEAIEAGAIAVITDVFDPFLKDITQVICQNATESIPDIANNFYNNPSNDLFTIGITGTNGKTTTSYLIKHILDKSHKKTGLIGSIEYILGEHKIVSKLTSPDSITLQKYLREMIISNCQSVCMEVSSHALKQNRVKNVDFDIAIFTNLTIDHLDYHISFENYKKAKKKLFDSLDEKSTSIVNIDDENYPDMIKDTKSKIFTFSLQKKADLYVSDIKFSLKGSYFTLYFKDKKTDVFTPLIGKYNIYNILAAISVGLIANIELEKIIFFIKNFKEVKGRLQKVENKKNLNIFVDFAHTDDALKNVLLTLREIKKGKIINVFGCGGNRDKSKRSLMAKASEKYADISIVTSDNPRDEDPEKIIDEVKSGFSKNSKFIIEKDRKKAIEKAISLANGQDIIIITGKGHETYQIFDRTTIEFDDAKIVKQICHIL